MLVAYRVWAALSSPLGRLVLIGLAFLAWTAYQRAEGRSQCETAQLEAELEETRRLLTESQGIADRARERADRTEAELSELKDQADDLSFPLPDSGACTLPDDLRDRLRAIR